MQAAFRIGGMNLLAAFLVVGSAGADESSPPKLQASQGWVAFAADSFEAWTGDTGDWVLAKEVSMDPNDEKRLAWKEGTGAFVNGDKGRTVHLLSLIEHGDVEAHIEFMVPKGSNSGVYFQGRYEIQVLDSWGVEELKHGDCGGIYQRWDNDKGFEGHPPRVNASLPPGQWQTFDVIFRAPRFENGKKVANAKFEKVLHNGKVVHENAELTGPTRASKFQDEQAYGILMLQGDHGPVAYRNIRIRVPKPKSEGSGSAE